jgi:hypothetical protein
MGEVDCKKGHVCMHSRMPFFVDDHGQLCLHQREDHTGLSMIPFVLRRKIWDSVLEDMSTVGIDMDTTAGFTTLYPMLYINYSLRNQYLSVFTQRPSLIVLRSTSERARFPNTAKLARLLYTLVPLRTRDFIRDDVGFCADLHFKVQVKLDKLLKLDEQRIDILPFVLASSLTWNETPLTIALDTPNREQQEFDLTLGLLRHQVLDALKAYASGHDGVMPLCPDVWINGYGLVKEVIAAGEPTSSTGHGTVVNMELDMYGEEAELGRRPPHLVNHQLDSTMRYLTWVVRCWLKADTLQW